MYARSKLQGHLSREKRPLLLTCIQRSAKSQNWKIMLTGYSSWRLYVRRRQLSHDAKTNLTIGTQSNMAEENRQKHNQIAGTIDLKSMTKPRMELHNLIPAQFRCSICDKLFEQIEWLLFYSGRRLNAYLWLSSGNLRDRHKRQCERSSLRLRRLKRRSYQHSNILVSHSTWHNLPTQLTRITTNTDHQNISHMTRYPGAQKAAGFLNPDSPEDELSVLGGIIALRSIFETHLAPPQIQRGRFMEPNHGPLLESLKLQTPLSQGE